MRSHLTFSIFMFATATVQAFEDVAPAELAPELAHESTILESAPWTGVVEDENTQGSLRVNVRSGEGVNYHILTVLERGARLKVVGRSGEWLKINLQDSPLPVWISREFATSVDDTLVEINADRVVLRGAATTKSSSLGTVSKGARLKVLESHPQWIRVEAPEGICGFIHQQFVKESAPAAEPVEVKQGSEPRGAEGSESAPLGAESSSPETASDEPEAKAQPMTDVLKIRKAYEERIAEIRKSRADELAQLQRFGLAGGFLATGLIVNEENSDLKVTHRVDLGDRTLYYIRSARGAENAILIDLDQYSGKKVGIRGKVVNNAGPIRIVEVTEVSLLDAD